ncbi:hypothetical protein [Burkholderia sp. TSV86]|uniref:hypothetical protein n=1 Tax=Burkholderia sp. TSV86 TaxID=1385594 RepID=UPI00076BF7BB|nr:hypothetical protein [Burkholderia sp. TSV86]KVE33692.1 hypothetical protein WS68_10940 [Burkholderia sp. TSV86]
MSNPHAATGESAGHNRNIGEFVPPYPLSDTPAAINYLLGRLLIAYQGPNNSGELYLTRYVDPKWSEPKLVPGVGISGGPAMAIYKNTLYLAHRGQGNDGNQVWITVSHDDGYTWEKDTRIENVGITGNPALAVVGNYLWLVHRGAGGDSNQLWYTKFNGVAWTKDTRIDGVTTSDSPALAVNGDTLWIYHRGDGSEANRCWVTWTNGIQWGADERVNELVAMDAAPAAVYSNKLGFALVHLDHNGDGNLFYLTSENGTSFGKDTWLDTTPNTATGSPAILNQNDRPICIYRGNDGKLHNTDTLKRT